MEIKQNTSPISIKTDFDSQVTDSIEVEDKKDKTMSTIKKISLIGISALGIVYTVLLVQNLHRVSKDNAGLGFFERPKI